MNNFKLSARKRGRSPQEPKSTAIVSCFHFGVSFFGRLGGRPQNEHFRRFCRPKPPKREAFGGHLDAFLGAGSKSEEMCFDHAGVCRLHVRPLREGPGSAQKSKKKEGLEKETFFQHFLPFF